MRKLLWIILFFFSFSAAEASHMVSGYIAYKCLSGTTYQITFYNFANTCNDAYDQDTVTMYFGDGTSQVVSRINGKDSNGFPDGVPVCNCRKICLYQTTHTYPGQGTYRIYVDDPARMASIANMINSSNQDFYVYSTITLNGFTGDSILSPVIANPLACVYACPGQCYYFNMGAYSPAGDSIAYSLGNCLGTGGTLAAGYFIPSVTTIDPVTGTLEWCSPPAPAFGTQGIYNFAINLVCYKRVYLAGGRIAEVEVDTTECELEVIVQGTCIDVPPVVAGPDDTCVVAGDTLKLNYVGTDATAGSFISLIASGAPFTASPPASTNNPALNNPVKLTFTWVTNCSEVRKNPYPLLVTGTVNDNPPLNGYKSTNIDIVGPPPTNITAKPIGNSIQLNWNASTCPQVTGYQVYRHIGCYKWMHGPCETGVPAYTGYVLIGTTTCPTSCTSYLDNNNGRGLTPGVFYDYMVVATYPLPDGSVSYASNDTCLKLRRDVPIITNVSVDNTSLTTGTVFMRWTKPLANATDLDTIGNPGPYTYKLMRANGINGNTFTAIATVSSTYFKPAIDTTYMDNGLNTQSMGYTYRIDFYSNSNLVGSSPAASSIYLAVKPDNNVLHLSWQSFVPWTDSSYSVYRSYNNAPFSLIATLPGTQQAYDDSNLTNGKSFCYYVESKSYYPDSSIIHPLFDSSEVMCGTPKDTIPPCPPNLAVTPECTIYHDSLLWNNPDYFCPKVENRILYYVVYYSPTQNQEMISLDTIRNLKDTLYIYDSIYSIAGCFAVVAVDSFYNVSPLNTICVDNCPEYSLPNVFTPNGDGKNDFFVPLVPYRYIKNIDLSVFNRWGQLVFHTNNPAINWDGTDQSSHKPCSDGVYFYLCQVNEIHLSGIKSVQLKGFIELLR